MVAAMSGLLRSARACVVALLALALMLGVNGFVGAIHSAHHPPAPAESHEHHGQDQAPAGAPDESCPVAAAALHLSATMVEAPPGLGALSPVARLVAGVTQDGPHIVWREPARGRAPPSFGSLSR